MIQHVACPHCGSILDVIIPEQPVPARVLDYSMTMAMTTICLLNLDAVPTGHIPADVQEDLDQARMCLQAVQERLREVD